jgi:hypothetical protein
LEKLHRQGEPLAAFIGAGAAKPTGILDWKELLWRLGTRVGMLEKEVTNRIGEIGYAKTASYICSKYQCDDDFFTAVGDLCDATNTETTSLLIRVSEWFRLVITTNFDKSIEEAFVIQHSHGGFDCQTLPDIDFAKTETRRPTLIYLHGHQSKGRYVLREEEYRVFYPSHYSSVDGVSKVEDFLKDLAGHVSTVFVGFSFEDEAFVNVLNKTRRTIIYQSERERERLSTLGKQWEPERQLLPHCFAFIETSNDGPDHRKRLEELRRMGIQSIPYPEGKHIYIERELKNIMSISRTSSQRMGITYAG